MSAQSEAANLREVEDKANNSIQLECAIESQQLNHGGPEMVDFNKNRVSKKKKVMKFYFVKFQPYKDPDEISKLDQAEKIIEKMDQEIIPLFESYWIKSSQFHNAQKQLNRLKRSKMRMGYALKNLMPVLLDHLEAALVKLNFPKNSSTKTCSFRGDQINQRLRMIHGRSMNLATENKLLKEISSINQLQISDDNGHNDSSYFMKNLNDIIRRLKDETRYKKILKKIKAFEEKMKKSNANPSIKGRIWDPWSSRSAIKDQITFIEKLLAEMKKEQAELIADIERSEKEKEIETTRKDEELFMMQLQLRDLNRRKYEAQNCILNLRRQHENANVSNEENLLLLRKARELARKKDMAAIEELCREEVDEFMSRWNNSEVFRDGYVRRILPSLNNRQLSGDGRMRNPDEEPNFYLKSMN